MLEVRNDFLLADMDQGREFTRSQRSLLQVFQDLLAQCLLSFAGFLGTLVSQRGVRSQVRTTISGT